MYQIRERQEADCDGGDTHFVVVDTSENETEVSDCFDTLREAEVAMKELCEFCPEKDPNN